MSNHRRTSFRGPSRLALAALLTGMAMSAGAAPPRAPLDETTGHARADKLIAQMTPEEKAGQLSSYFYISMFAPLVTATDKIIRSGGTGSVLFVNDPATTNRLQTMVVEENRHKIAMLFGYGVIHGLRTIMPVPLGMAAS